MELITVYTVHPSQDSNCHRRSVRISIPTDKTLTLIHYQPITSIQITKFSKNSDPDQTLNSTTAVGSR